MVVDKLLLLGVAVGKASSLAFDSDALEELCRFFLLFLLSLLDMICYCLNKVLVLQDSCCTLLLAEPITVVVVQT